MEILISSIAAGLIFGSFANVYFYRFPIGRSLVHPGSSCPKCSAPISWFDNIPVLSYILLKAKCRHCGDPISIKYPLVEAASGVLFGLTASRFPGASLFTLSALLLFGFLLFLAAGMDIVTFFRSGKEYGIIPDHLVWIMAGAGLLFLPANPELYGRWWNGIAGGIAGGLLILAVRWAGQWIYKKEAMGFGDVKFAAAAGLWLGWPGILHGLMAAFIAGGIFGGVMMAAKKMERNSPIPFGPFLAAGFFGALLLRG